MLDYDSFLASKRITVPSVGVEVDPSTLHPALKPHQRAITTWALKKGRAAVWCDTGLGKAFIALEWAQQLINAGRVTRVLIPAPLSVAQQFVREGEKWGYAVTYARSEAESPDAGIVTTNYERLHLFAHERWQAVAPDESSILKNFSGTRKNQIVRWFRHARYKLPLTATPAPNDTVELCNHADFLGVMSQADMLSTFFISKGDDQKASRFRLKRHARTAFYEWLAQWAVACRTPSDLGYSDDGYVLPPLRILPEIVPTDWRPAGQLFFTTLKGVTERAAVRRDTAEGRIAACARLVEREPDERWLLWYGLLDEAAGLERAIPGAVVLRGADSAERKDEVLSAFSRGEIDRLVTHASIAGFGMNFQACARMAFVGLSDSYETYYQAIRRCYRFGQERGVDAYIVLSEPERAIYDNVLRKEREANELTDGLVLAMRDFERAELAGERPAVTDPYAPTKVPTRPAWLTTITPPAAAEEAIHAA